MCIKCGLAAASQKITQVRRISIFAAHSPGILPSSHPHEKEPTMDHATAGAATDEARRATIGTDRARLQRLIDLLERYDLSADWADQRGDLSVQLRRLNAILQ
jgi:hypothetical protein